MILRDEGVEEVVILRRRVVGRGRRDETFGRERDVLRVAEKASVIARNATASAAVIAFVESRQVRLCSLGVDAINREEH